MIIAISGPSSTGKTTLVQSLKNYKGLIESILGRQVYFKGEDIREMLPADAVLDEVLADSQVAMELQFKIIESNIERYMDLLKNPHIAYICDRCPLDNVVYMILNYMRTSPELALKYAADFRKYGSIAKSLTSYVERIYLTKNDNSMLKAEPDGFRASFYDTFRALEVELFNGYFDNLPTVKVLPSESADRLNFLLNDLKMLNAKLS